MKERVQDWGVVMLLCDYAEEVGGKLYVMGGGWSQLRTPNQPTNMALAIKLAVPWSQANERHELAIRLLTADDSPVKNEQNENVEIMGQIEVGRPPGIRAGSSLDLPLAARFDGLKLDPGSYRWRLEVDGTPLEHTTFDVIKPG